ncbi:MAG: phosphonopyruvate decarboxylase [Alphaproteobacteria bacterium]|nr:phosphonopyruvate decarboxylase [Alphaproteobacteria bacterium]
MTQTGGGGTDWSAGAHRALSGLGVGIVGYVPDAGLSRLITLCQADNRMRSVPLTTEEEGIALAAGAWLGGMPATVFMQSSGVGNIVNALAMMQTCRFPLVMLVTMRGELGEANEWQIPMGQAAAEVLRLAAVDVHRPERAEDIADTVAAAATTAFRALRREAVLIPQRIVGIKRFAGAGSGE